ncbi:uncharacterized protein TNCV_477761 [Trichonephila clavipes]|nr:uncharacterized protein TNCV_477761 [Trichonephila clavipes]
MGDGGISRNGVHIETPDSTFDIKIRDINNRSFLGLNLLQFIKGLLFVVTASDLVFRDIWILTDSRASIQHLSRWTIIGDMASLNILNIVVRLSSGVYDYFQWVPFHNGLNGNEISESLAKSGTADTFRSDTCLTFTELFSIKKIELNTLWRLPLAHPWHFGKKLR